MLITNAIVRRPGENFSEGITTSTLGKPDFVKALGQHAAYCEILNSCGVSLTILGADSNHPDGCFVEDTAVIVGEIAVITRPGAVSRRGEEDEIEKCISEYKKTFRIISPGTLDGGDILRAEDHFYIGLSQRTNAEGASQLAKILNEYGYTASTIPVGEGLHLKSGLSYIGKGNFLVSPAFRGAIKDGNEIFVNDDESYAVNSLFVNGTLIIASGYPVIKENLTATGYNVVETDMSEFRKMDGGLTCLSLLFSL